MVKEKCAVMNYLAHAYLSFGYDEVLIGNMISDFVKGRKKFDYSTGIQQGIALHRAIDTFTDDHAATRAAKQFFKPAVGAYSGAFVDVVYDHFLAIDEIYWQDKTLPVFATEVYTTLEHNIAVLPERFAAMLPSMTTHNWLYNYRLHWGIERSFEGVRRRARYLESSEGAYGLFIDHYTALEKLAQDFLPDVKKFASGELDRLLST